MSKVGLHEFGSFRLYPSKRLLLRYGAPVPLSPRAFDILSALVHHGGEVLCRDDLLRRVWPDSYAEAANLTIHVSELNRTLGRTSDGREYIETAARKGYRFQVPVRQLEEEASEKLIEAPALPAAGDPAASWGRRGTVLLTVAAFASLLLVGGGLLLKRRLKPSAEIRPLTTPWPTPTPLWPT
jgi:DNA-binding winged helix-turn-helix (wHTH) protein